MPNLIMIVLLIIAVAIGSFLAGRKTVPQEQAVYWRSIRGGFGDRPRSVPRDGKYGGRRALAVLPYLTKQPILRQWKA
jgi:hypothetical protein